MTEVQATYSMRMRNPDVLSCIANLSNDEVFTPPDFAGQMLDDLARGWSAGNAGAGLWTNPDVRFLDPFTKSGVFLREITKRLIDGLAEQIPDLNERVEHILVNQVFGIGITEICSLLARRSLYCSKDATGVHSVVRSFKRAEGNIAFERIEHTWVGGTKWVYTADQDGNQIKQMMDARCKYCGTSQTGLDRGSDLETHAYALIHADDPMDVIVRHFGAKMQFDVIIGNPPYQLSTDGHGTQARPIYNLFVEQAKSLEPRFLSMVFPARWFSGGMGLDTFREKMLNDTRIRSITDFPDSNDVFPGTQIKGGVCYMLWDRDNPGLCDVTTYDKGKPGAVVARPLVEPGADVFIRYNEALSILKKVMACESGLTVETTPCAVPQGKEFKSLVSSIGAFGLDTKFRGKDTRGTNDLKVYRNSGVGYMPANDLHKERHMVGAWKVFIPRAGSGSDSFPHPILGKPFVGEPGSISSWTYMHFGPFNSEAEAQNVISYVSTRLFRFLVLLHKPSQDATRAVYTFVPTQDFSRPWTDADLYEKYGLSDHEISFIESLIRPMELY